MRYLAPLDGIRAVAILAVVVFHVSPAALRGGFTGVDVFYVLSGFLITSILLHDIRGGSFSIREFYLRRIQRLLPNLVVTVMAVLVLWTLFLPPSMSRQTGRHGLWTLFSLSNVFVWRYLGGYWGDAAEWAPLTHTWSLGIEEQFYLFFPGSLLLLSRCQPTRVRSWLTIAAVLSFGLCLYGTRTYPVATFYILPTRVWELLLGAVLAARQAPLLSTPTQPAFRLGARARESLGWIGLGVIAAGFLSIDESPGFPGLAALAPTAGTALVLLSVAEGETRVARLLSLPLMRGLGKFSYSLYLWHWPLITLGKILADLHGLPRLAGAAAGGLAGILLAWGAFVLVEQPLRRRGPGRRRRLVTIAAGLSVAALGSFVVASRRPVADPDRRFDTSAFHGMLFNAGPPTSLSLAARYYDMYFPPQPPGPPDAWRRGGVVHLFGDARPQVVVLGSSHALMYSRLVDDICRELGLSVAFLARDGMSAFFEDAASVDYSSLSEAREFDEARRTWLREWRPAAVFVIDRWDLRGRTSREFDTALRAFLREVSPLTGRVLFVTQIPALDMGYQINLREFISWRMNADRGLPRLVPDKKEPLRKQLVAAAEAAVADFPNLRVLRADLPFCQQDGSVRYAAGRTLFYADDDHLTEKGADEVRQLFQSALVETRPGLQPGSPGRAESAVGVEQLQLDDRAPNRLGRP